MTITDPIPANTTFAVAPGRRHGRQRQGHLERTDVRRAGERRRALHRQHRLCARQEGQVDRQRRPRRHLRPGRRDDGLAARDPDRPAVSRCSVTPATQTDGGNGPADGRLPRPRSSNLGFNTDTYSMSSSGRLPVHRQRSSTRPARRRWPRTTPGRVRQPSADVCVRVNDRRWRRQLATDTDRDGDVERRCHGVVLPRTSRRSRSDRRHAAGRQRQQQPGRPAVLHGRPDGCRTSRSRRLGSDGRRITCRRRTCMAHERRLVHRQQLPGTASGRTRTELTAFLDGGGRLFMSGQDILDQARRDDARSSTTTCTSTGTARRPRTTRARRTSRRGRQPGDGRYRHRAARPQRPRRRVRGPDHPDRTARCRRSPTTRSRPTHCPSPARTRSSSSPSRWRRTETRRRRPTSSRG